jgi:hypothetical protein
VKSSDDLCLCAGGTKYKECCAKKRKAEARRAMLDAAAKEVRELLESRSFASPEQVLRGCYSSRCLDSFAGFLGLVEIQRDSGERFSGDFRLRKLPLLDHVVQFHL